MAPDNPGHWNILETYCQEPIWNFQYCTEIGNFTLEALLFIIIGRRIFTTYMASANLDQRYHLETYCQERT